MATRPATITKADIKRAVEAIVAAGLKVTRVEVEGAKVVVCTLEGGATETPLQKWVRTNAD